MGVLELKVNEKLESKTIEELNIPNEFMVIAIKSMDKVEIPQLSTKLKKNEIILALVKTESLNKIREKFNLK